MRKMKYTQNVKKKLHLLLQERKVSQVNLNQRIYRTIPLTLYDSVWLSTSTVTNEEGE